MEESKDAWTCTVDRQPGTWGWGGVRSEATSRIAASDMLLSIASIAPSLPPPSHLIVLDLESLIHRGALLSEKKQLLITHLLI